MNLFCQIYVQLSSEEQSLLQMLSDKIGGEVSHGAIRSQYFELFVDKNVDFDPRKITEFPDGFLFFKWILNIEPDESKGVAEYMKSISRLLEILWQLKIPAIAACDFETSLPYHGGYKQKAIPWPGG